MLVLKNFLNFSTFLQIKLNFKKIINRIDNLTRMTKEKEDNPQLFTSGIVMAKNFSTENDS